MLINLLQDEDQATDAPATDGDTDGDTAETPEAPAEGGDSDESPAEGGGDETPAA